MASFSSLSHSQMLTAVSQTGGHGDSRAREDDGSCSAGGFGGLLVDGVPEVTRAARNLMRKGADHIKVSRQLRALHDCDPDHASFVIPHVDWCSACPDCCCGIVASSGWRAMPDGEVGFDRLIPRSRNLPRRWRSRRREWVGHASGMGCIWPWPRWCFLVHRLRALVFTLGVIPTAPGSPSAPESSAF